MKKLLVVLATLAIMAVCFALLPTEAQAADGAGQIGECSWVLEGTTLTIRGNGRMGTEGSGSLQPWGQNVTHVIIEEGVTHIGQEAFFRCPLEYVSIASTVSSIGPWAFQLSSLRSIIIPEGVTNIGEGAFTACWSLEYIKLPSTLTTIGRWAFSECNKLKSIVLSAGVTRIDNSAFNHCNIGDVWYLGSESDKASLSIGGYNACLYTATWHYNSCPIGAPHAYNGICDNSCNGCGKIREVPDHSYDSACDNSCNGCGELRTVPDHIYDNACDAECNVCRYIRNVSHRYGTEWIMTNTDHWHECSSCGDKKDITTHNYTNACDLDCNICGYGRAVTHSYESTWNANAASHWHECSVCNDKKDLNAHNPGSAATETAAQTCTICGYVIQAALNHMHSYTKSWCADTTGHWYACTCGSQKDYAEHSYKNSCDADCDVCGYTCTITHIPGAPATDSTDQVCTVCGKVLTKATGGAATTPPATVAPTEPTTPSTDVPIEPATGPNAEPTESMPTDTDPSGTDAVHPESTSPTPTEPGVGNEDNTGATWIIITAAVILLGGGAATGIIIWKKKH